MISKQEYNLLHQIYKKRHINNKVFQYELNLLFEEKLIRLVFTPNCSSHTCSNYEITPQGQRAIEEYEEFVNTHENRDMSVSIAKEANQLSKESNNIAQSTNRIAKESNLLSIIAIIISCVCCIATIVTAIISAASCAGEFNQHFVYCYQHHFFAMFDVYSYTVV